MAFLRKQTSEGSIGLLYSVIQKCMRRGLEEECLYYSDILFKEGTPNSLRILVILNYLMKSLGVKMKIYINM